MLCHTRWFYDLRRTVMGFTSPWLDRSVRQSEATITFREDPDEDRIQVDRRSLLATGDGQPSRACRGGRFRYAEVPLSWAPNEAEAARSAREEFRFGLTGWKVQSELPNPVNIEAATAFITEDDMREVFGVGPDASAHLAVAQQFVDAGYDHLALINAGPDPDGFFDFFASELAEPLRKLTPTS